MPRFAANLLTLFTEVPLLDRFERAARAGFQTVELQFPYEAPAAAIRERLVSNRLTMCLHNLPVDNLRFAAAALKESGLKLAASRPVVAGSRTPTTGSLR